MSLVIAIRFIQLGFDFYMSPTGDDNNPGTLSQPWSITAFNSKGSTYSGKRVGLLPGVYQYGTVGGVQTSLYTLCQNIAGGAGSNPGVNNAISINGGSSGSPTYVGSCNSQGNYSARAAILYPADISTGNRSTSECGVIGQAYSAHGSGIHEANTGNVIIDGLVIHKWFQWAIAFYPAVAGTYPTSVNTGIQVVNCEIYDGVGNGNDNSSPIVFQACSGAYAGNNKLHDHIKVVSTGNNISAIYAFSCHGNLYELNTIYNIGIGIFDKDGPQGSPTHRYNLVEIAGAQPYKGMNDCQGGLAADTANIHHNIYYCSATSVWNGRSSNSVIPCPQTTNFYNNTVIYSYNGGPGLEIVQNSGPLSLYNNIIVCQVHSTNGLIQLALGGSYSLGAYNVFDDLTHNPTFATNPNTSSFTPTTGYSLSTWSTATGQDSTSVVATPTFVGSFGVQNAANYQLTGSVGIGTAHVGGVSGGAAINAGAWDGIVTQIGCNF